jgi:hypothetical protein
MIPMLKGIYSLTRAEAILIGYISKSVDVDTVFIDCYDFVSYLKSRRMEMTVPTAYRAICGLIDKDFLARTLERNHYFFNKSKFNHGKD